MRIQLDQIHAPVRPFKQPIPLHLARHIIKQIIFVPLSV